QEALGRHGWSSGHGSDRHSSRERTDTPQTVERANTRAGRESISVAAQAEGKTKSHVAADLGLNFFPAAPLYKKPTRLNSPNQTQDQMLPLTNCLETDLARWQESAFRSPLHRNPKVISLVAGWAGRLNQYARAPLIRQHTSCETPATSTNDQKPRISG